ncbi:hypothetical protein [Schlesneria paludicola]|uniref:hypothetical protein n=1 Tax=Schlesneria paludicola TaxID=360056 RepID=UPI00029AD89B|nr:hypothetical protein [Schlesneria paludicola]
MLWNTRVIYRLAHTLAQIAFAAILLSGLVLAKDDHGRITKLFQQLEGRWKITEVEVSGEKVESDEEWSFTHGNYTWRDSKREIRGEGSINDTWNPHQIYFKHKHSSLTGRIETDVRNWDTGIYKLSDDGDTLTVCIGRLPLKEFTTSKDDGRRLFVLKRIKDKVPAN